MLQIMSAVSYLRALSDSQIGHISRIDNSIRFNQSITLHVCCLSASVCVCEEDMTYTQLQSIIKPHAWKYYRAGA